MEHAQLLLILAIGFGFFMAWGIGANDVANAMGTSVGSRALTYFKATVIAGIFEVLGAILAGGQVTDTIRSQVIDYRLLTDTPELIVYGMLASLIAASVWLFIATQRGLPVSTTHTVVGAVVGFGAINLGMHSIKWHVVGDIVLSWVLTPFIAGLVAFTIFVSIKKTILTAATPLEHAKRYTPFYASLVVFVIALVTLNKGLAHLNLAISVTQSTFASLCMAAVAFLISFLLLRRYTISGTTPLQKIESIFALLQIMTACCMAFAHGANDVANAIGPLAAIVDILQSGGVVSGKAGIPFWILALGAAGIVTGLATYGFKVIATVGRHITDLTPSRGFSAELATASTVIIASGFGLPISTTQTLVGAIIGVAFARGISALNMKVIRSIFLSWVITLPAGAILSVGFFYLIKLLVSYN